MEISTSFNARRDRHIRKSKVKHIVIAVGVLVMVLNEDWTNFPDAGVSHSETSCS